MKKRYSGGTDEIESHLVARFGDANLVHTAAAGYELRNASPEDCTAAKEWVSLFMHEAVIDSAA